MHALASLVAVGAIGLGLSSCSSNDDPCACSYPADEPTESRSASR